MTQARYRILQGLRHLTDRETPSIDATIRELLNPAQWALVSRLSPADRAHLLRVHQELVRQGVTDQDLLLAGLLHDIGKADDYGRVTVFHRTLNVLFGRIAPQVRRQLVNRERNWITHGMYLTLEHSRLGGDLARSAGASERTCWLIAHHDDGTISDDADLKLLQEIDARE
jgi:hypothetical protein